MALMAAIHARTGGGLPGQLQGLPGQLPHAGIGGAASAIPPAPQPDAGASDKQSAERVVQVLHAALGATQDAQLKSTYASALQALTKYLAADEKEVHAALGGKLSPRIMAKAYAPRG